MNTAPNSEVRAVTRPAVWIGLLVAGVCAVWALQVASSGIGFASSEEPLSGFWLPSAMFAVLLILVIGVLPNAYMAWVFRRKVPVASTLIAIGSIVAIIVSYFVAQAKHGAMWGTS